MSQSMNFHGVNAVRLLLTNMVFAGGFQSDNFTVLPIIIFVAVFEKQIMDGIMAGGVKA